MTQLVCIFDSDYNSRSLLYEWPEWNHNSISKVCSDLQWSIERSQY